MSDLDIRNERDGLRGRLTTIVAGHEAELIYQMSGSDRILALHTGVPGAIGGRGVGQDLVAQLVSMAEEDGRKILPICSYVDAMLRRRSDWVDLIDA